MYYKLSSIVLNSGKNLKHSGDVYISQPNSELEVLAGNFFIIVELSDKRAVSQKVCDFLAAKLEEHYYNDDKLSLTDRVEGLKIASIFESALAKTNRDFSEFLQTESIKLNSAEDGLTIGLVYQNKLYFSIFGKNKAFLIYKKNNEYDILNVESSAQESDEEIIVGDENDKQAKVFSAVINGEIPSFSYFVLTNEALPEYLSSQDMINTVIKLPPVVACEQMKNILSGINSFIPFLGIVIKNVYNTQESFENTRAVETLTAHESISHLNYTEKRTEKMLSPAGLIDLRKLANRVNKIKFRLPGMNIGGDRKMAWRDKPEKSDQTEIRKNSFVLKDKIILKKQAKNWALKAKQAALFIASLFTPSFWKNFWSGIKIWFANLNRTNRFILKFLSAVLIFLIVSIGITSVRNKHAVEKQQFADVEQLIKDKSDSIDASLLYNNRAAAQADWQEVSAALSSLPQEKESQKEQYNNLQQEAMSLHDKAYGISRIKDMDKIWDASSTNSFVGGTFSNSQAFLVDANNKKLDIVSLDDKSVKETSLDYDLNQINSRLYVYDDVMYILHGEGLIEYDIKSDSSKQITLPNNATLTDVGGWGMYFVNSSSNLYVADTAQNQIFKYRIYNSSAGSKSAWLQESASLSDVISLYVDGHIYALHADGKIEDYYLNIKADVNFDQLESQPSSASFLLKSGENIAVCDLKNRSLAVWDKEGHLKQQYIFSDVNQILSFGLSDDGNTAYVFDGSAIYSVSLSSN